MVMKSCLLSVTAAALALAVPAVAQGLPVEPKTPAAIIAIDEAWDVAEADGDTAFVDRLLLPEYRSVGSAGKVTSKAAIIAGSLSHAGSTRAAEEIDAWKAAHPLRGKVVIVGDTAVLTWVSAKPASGEPISSCDIFLYREGHWRAIYSQHSNASV